MSSVPAPRVVLLPIEGGAVIDARGKTELRVRREFVARFCAGIERAITLDVSRARWRT